jgi:hypothetical protein
MLFFVLYSRKLSNSQLLKKRQTFNVIYQELGIKTNIKLP